MYNRLIFTVIVAISLTAEAYFSGASGADSHPIEPMSNSPNWTREFLGGMKPGKAGSVDYPRFTIITASSIDDHIVGSFTLVFDSTPPITLSGTKTSDGNFWPYVTAQVGNEDREWRTLGKPVTPGKPTSVSIHPKDLKTVLSVDLDIFRPMVGKFRYGRVILENGDAATCDLADLAPAKHDEIVPFPAESRRK